jgi:predicted TIM-barrel fold metal-dependent hydrolase
MTAMISRRHFLLGSIATGVLATRVRAGTDPSQPSTRVNFAVPAGACDCHLHIFGDPKQYPLSPTRTYTPETSTVAQARALHVALHVDRLVLVQPSIFGADNACMVDALKEFGVRARGVAVIDDSTPDHDLDAMHLAGVRGVRINLGTAGVTDPTVARQRFAGVAKRMKDRRWFIQMYTQLSVIDAIRRDIEGAGVPVVFDHFGQAEGALGLKQPGFDTLLGLVQSGHAYVKVSAPYMCSTQEPDYPDMRPLAQALIGANPKRVLWGTNWPHANSAPPPGGTAADVTPLRRIDDGHILNQLATWATDAATRKMILVDNPQTLYGF